MKTTLYRIALVLLLWTPSPGASQENPFRTKGIPPPDELIKGRMATLELLSGKLRGELLSVSEDSLWVLSIEGRRAVALPDVKSADVQMHAWGPRRMLTWNLIAGLGSAVALTAACGSVDGADGCGDVFLTWSGIWGVIGGIAGVFIARGSSREVEVSPETLRSFVRYPQGLPSTGDSSRSTSRGSSGGR